MGTAAFVHLNVVASEAAARLQPKIFVNKLNALVFKLN